MSRWSRIKGWVRLAPAVGALAMGPSVGFAEEIATNVRLVNNSHRFAVALALRGAVRQMAQPGCQALLDEFQSVSGRPLRDGLADLGMSPTEYLQGGVFFYDASERLCGTSSLAVTVPGSRAVLVCGPRFVREMKRDSRRAEAVLIHETLHSLGLGENPPTTDEITARVRARCGQTGPPPARTHIVGRP